MKTSLFAFASLLSFAVGCTTNKEVSTQTVATSSSATVAPAPSGSAATANTSTPTVQSASVVTGNSTYTAAGLTLTASSAWQETASPVTQVALQLVNRTQEISFSVVTTTSRYSEKEYIQRGVTELKDLGLTTTLGSTTVNGTKYATLTSNSESQTTLQWVSVSGNTVRVLTCSGPHFTTSDTDACQAVVSTVTTTTSH